MTGEGLDAILFDDRVADGWAPFALTRPCGEILYGRWRTRERIERAIGTAVIGHVTRDWLDRYCEPGAPPVVRPDAIDPGRTRLLWSARAILDPAERIGAAPANLRVGGDLAGVVLTPGAETPDASWFATPTAIPGLPDRQIRGEWLEHAWDLASGGADRLRTDLESILESDVGVVPDGVHRLGDAPISLDAGVTLEPGVLLDVRAGPVVLARGVEVRTGTRLAGPIYVGPGSRLLGGDLSSLAAGPLSILRGEMEEVTVFGYSNKAHDGFIGHSVLGAWVNLGAMTTNSDLKNNYGSVRMGPPGRTVDTGLLKVGSLIGDHVKTGIGALLNTGTIVGAGSNLFGSALPPKWVPPFSWGQGRDLVEYRREAFLSTAATVLPRRGMEANDEVLGWLGDVWDAVDR